MKQETKLGSRAFVPVLMCQTIENIIWATWGRRQNNPGASCIASLMRSVVFYNIVIIKDNFLSHRSEPGAHALISSWCIDSTFFLNGSVSLRSVSLWKETDEANWSLHWNGSKKLQSIIRFLRISEKKSFRKREHFLCQTLEASCHFWWYLTLLIRRVIIISF